MRHDEHRDGQRDDDDPRAEAEASNCGKEPAHNRLDRVAAQQCARKVRSVRLRP